LHDAHYVINTIDREKTTGTPLFSNNELAGCEKICMDVVYGHRSFFLELAKQLGHSPVAGEWMLLHQAVRAFEYVFQDAVKEKGITTSEIEKPMRMALQSGIPIDASYEDTRSLVQ